MIKKTFQKKAKYFVLVIAVLSLLIPVNNLQAQGSISPEAASFEPVDASDMVNLLTGDLSYVLPLLNVPSPEGGFPLALSYHAGIAMEQEASWVGLGWSLNPGAINRSVNGYPDDWKNGIRADIIYDIGGEYTGYFLGVSVGIGGKDSGFSIGLYGSYSQNKAFGGETSHSFDVGVSGSAFGFQGNLGTDGVGLSYGNGLNIGINQSFKTGQTSVNGSLKIAGTGMSLDSQSGFGASVFNTPISLSGSSTQSTQLSFNNTNIGGTIPIYGINISFGYQKSRYWLFDRTQHDSYGSLYLGALNEAYNNALFKSLIMADAYESLYKANQSAQLGENNFSFVSYDSYSVSGQGIGGTLTPNLYDIGSLKLKSQKTNVDEGYSNTFYDGQINKQLGDSINDVYFYFDNTYASYLKTSINSINTPISGLSDIMNISFNGETLDSSILIDGELKDNYNTVSKRKTNGAYVEVYTNGEILNNPSLIIEAIHLDRQQNYAFDSSDNFVFDFGYEEGIGAYKITGMDGKTYHYSLPVYQKEQFTRRAELNNNIDEKYYEEQSISPYATHWLLTAITGPDYIDINSNGVLDEADYGYWVEFEYGKWSNDYVWRNPTDPNKYFTTNTSKSYTVGVKEVYYLDKIRTRTHTALFIKEDRKDNISYDLNFYSEIDDVIVKSFQLGSDDNFYLKGLYSNTNALDLTSLQGSPLNYYAYSTYRQRIDATPHRSLRLDKILVLENSKIPNELITQNSQEPNSMYNGNLYLGEYTSIYNTLGQQIYGSVALFTYPNSYYGGGWNYHGRILRGEFYENVLDVQDISILAPNIEQDALKVIDFNYDETYPLAKSSANSNAGSRGKLTLDNIEIKGKGGVSFLPSFKFDYADKNVVYNYNLMDDWGYHKDQPQVWSLNQITTPTGSKINLQYEEDDYYTEAADAFRIIDEGLEFFLNFPAGDTSTDIILEVTNDNDSETAEIDDFRKYFQIGADTRLSNFFICRREKYGNADRETKLFISEQNAEIIAVNQAFVEIKIDGNSGYWSFNDQDMDWLVNRTFAHNGVWHANGASDGVIMRNDDVSENQCKSWRRSYNNSDVTFFYRLLGNTSLQDSKGGGVRVKQVDLFDGEQTFTKQYTYNAKNHSSNPNFSNYKSSGITSYTPAKYHKEIKYMTEMPAPYVMYGRVGVKNTSAQATSDETTYYYFNTLNPDLNQDNGTTTDIGGALTMTITQDAEDQNIIVNGENSTVTRKKYELQNNLAALGRLESKEVINAYGQILSKVTNNYKDINNIKQGISKETFKVFKHHDLDGYIENHVNVSSKTIYPSVLESTTSTQGGFETTKHYDKHDFNTGQLLESRTIDSKGTIHKSKKVPAYKEYQEMGSKVNNANYKNMLIQLTGDYNYLVDAGQDKEVAAQVTTWNKTWSYRGHDGIEDSPLNSDHNIWRKQATYVWESDVDDDGLILNFTPFNYSATAQVNEWKKTSEITRYDHFSSPLEVKGINENYRSSKLVDESSKIAVNGNARYTEMYYSGAEYIHENNTFQGEVLGADFRNNGDAHTGKWCVKNDNTNDKVFQVKASVNSNVNNGEVRPGKYKVSFWTKPINPLDQDDGTRLIFNGLTIQPSEVISADCWKMYNYYINIDTGQTQMDVYVTNALVAGNSFDDFRLHPISSQINSYVYNDDTDELIAILNGNNLATKYCYDNAGRLCSTYAEIVSNETQAGGFKLINQNKYHYKDFSSNDLICDCELTLCNGGDIDGDGIVNDNDNCPEIYNPRQEDDDNDGIGNVCDYDADNDGVNDDSDNCVNTANPDQEDNDNDGIGDICDDDDDNDGILDVNDNCDFVVNVDQVDTDSDGIGNACDFAEPDTDGDGIADIYDTCLNIPNAFDNMSGGTVFPDPVNMTCDPNSYPPAPDYSGLQGNALGSEEKTCDTGVTFSDYATVLSPQNGTTVNPTFTFKIMFNSESVDPLDNTLGGNFNRFINIIRTSDNTIVASFYVTEGAPIKQEYGSSVFDFGLITLEENEQYSVEVSKHCFFASGIAPICLDQPWQFSTGAATLAYTNTVQFRNTLNSDFDRGASYSAMGDYGNFIADPNQALEYYEAHVIGNNSDGQGADPGIPNPYTNNDYFGRGFLYFDTGQIPENATITSAKLKFYISESGSSNGTELIIQKGYQEPKVPHSFLGGGIQFSSFDTNIIGQYNVASNITNWTEIEIPITLSADVINKTGLSKFVLREIHDYLYTQNPIYPVGNYVKTWISNVVGTGSPGWFKTDKLPVLEVNYTIQ